MMMLPQHELNSNLMELILSALLGRWNISIIFGETFPQLKFKIVFCIQLETPIKFIAKCSKRIFFLFLTVKRLIIELNIY